MGFQEDFESQELTNESIGVDVGLKELFVASNGTKERNINKDAKVKKLLKRKSQRKEICLGDLKRCENSICWI